MAAVVSSIGRTLYRVVNAFYRLLAVGALFVVVCCGLIWAFISMPFRWRPKPFDATIWGSTEARRNGDRYRVIGDLIRKIRDKSREEVITFLGEPDRPCPRHDSADPEQNCDLAYYLCPSRPIGRWELLIRLNEQAKVKAANAAYFD